MKKLGILLSGRGSNFEAIARNVQAGKIPAEIAVVISNKEDALGLARAREMGLATRFIPSKGKEREAFDREVAAVLKEFQVDLVCLAGFMRILSPYFVREFPRRILNIHPALLPAFPGEDAQRQALEYGVKFTGCTVHIVDEGVDTGPIICQAVVPVLERRHRGNACRANPQRRTPHLLRGHLSAPGRPRSHRRPPRAGQMISTLTGSDERIEVIH